MAGTCQQELWGGGGRGLRSREPHCRRFFFHMKTSECWMIPEEIRKITLIIIQKCNQTDYIPLEDVSDNSFLCKGLKLS